MKTLFSILITAIVVLSCTNNKKAETTTQPTSKSTIDSSLVTDSAWGPITTTTDFKALQNSYGAANVKDERICGPECIDSINVTKVHPGTAKEIIVYWKDSAYHKSIGMLESYADGSPYHTATGLKIGSSLKDILTLNGKSITFSGFGWDYGGYIQSFDSGKLEKSPVHFRLDLRDDTGNDLSGDIELNTDMPAVQKKLDKIKVYQLSLSFYKDGE